MAKRLGTIPLSRDTILCLLLGSGDFCSDIIFCRTSWARVERISAVDGYSTELHDAQMLALLGTLFVVVPFLLTVVPLVYVLYTYSQMIDSPIFSRHASFYGCLLVLTLTNLDLLKLLPWREVRFDGLPTARVLALTFFTLFAEDLPQTVIQTLSLVATLSLDRRIAEPFYSISLTVVSLSFSLGSIWWRGFRKLILILFVSKRSHLHLAPSVVLSCQRSAHIDQQSAHSGLTLETVAVDTDVELMRASSMPIKRTLSMPIQRDSRNTRSGDCSRHHLSMRSVSSDDSCCEWYQSREQRFSDELAEYSPLSSKVSCTASQRGRAMSCALPALPRDDTTFL